MRRLTANLHNLGLKAARVEREAEAVVQTDESLHTRHCSPHPLLYFWSHFIHKAAGGGNHRLCVAVADAQHNMLHSGVGVAFDVVDYLLCRGRAYAAQTGSCVPNGAVGEVQRAGVSESCTAGVTWRTVPNGPTSSIMQSKKG